MSSQFSQSLRNKIGFKFKAGDRVLISRSANYYVKNDAFTKKSVVGSYTKKVHVVENAFLKSNSKHFLVPVYRLRSIEGLFYPSELIPAPPRQQRRGRVDGDYDADDVDAIAGTTTAADGGYVSDEDEDEEDEDEKDRLKALAAKKRRMLKRRDY